VKGWVRHTLFPYELGNGAQETTEQEDDSNPVDEINTLVFCKNKG